MSRDEHPAGPVLQAFLDGELPPAVAAGVRGHCAVCTECRAALDGLAEVRALVADAAPAPASDPAWPRIAERLRRGERRRAGLPFRLGVAAAALAGLVLGIAIGAPARRPPSAGESPPSSAPVGYGFGAGSHSLLDVFAGVETSERS